MNSPNLFKKLHTQRHEIMSLAQIYGARRIRVFGSVGRGEDNEHSDIDFLVDFPHGYDLFTQRLPLAEKLESLTGRKVDLIPEHELNPYLRHTVLQEAKDL